jgi:outer membrane receptor protein involved in Fe transport
MHCDKYSGRRLWLLVLLIPIVALLSLRPLGAQTVYGSIYGTVLDTSGAVVPNAAILVKSQQKDTSFNAQTNSVGQYRIDHLVPDTYSVTVTASGFKSYTVNNLQVNAGETPKVDANLEVGSVDQSITVSASSEELLKTEHQDVALSIQQETIQDLPIVGQSMSNILLLSPGAYAALGQMGVQAMNPAGGSEFAINGQPVGGANFTLDGTDNTGQTLGYIVVSPAPNTVQEAKVITTSFVAETGRTLGAEIAMQTKSGANTFHGMVGDTRQSAANLARDPYAAAQSAPGNIAPALYNQPEINIGGPILKNRMFFFFDYFGLRQRQGASVTTTLPTAHLEQTCTGAASTSDGRLGCDFGEYITLLGTSLGTIYHQPDATHSAAYAYTNNIIPASEISPQALALLKMLPAPNISNSVYNNYSVNATGAINTNQFTTRVDYQLTPKIHTLGRWTYYRDDLVGHPIFGTAGGTSGVSEAGHGTGRTHSVSLGADDAISDRLLMDFRLGYYEDHLTDDMANPDLNLGTQLGIPGLNGMGYPLSNGSPVFNIATPAGGGTIGSTQLGGAASTPVRQREDQFQLTNNWTRIMGTHTIKVGVDLRYGRENRQESFDSRTGNLTFGTGPTSNNGVGGLGMATFMLGNVSSFIRDVSQVLSPKESQKRTFFYGQDTWRITQKLTVNLGLRWEIYFPEKVDAKGHGALLNLETGLLQVAGYGPYGMAMGQTTNFTDVGPRLGFSYQLNNKTVVRAGYGRSFAQANYGSIFSQVPVENPPVYGTQNLAASTTTGSVFTLAEGPTAPSFPTVPSSGVISVPDGVTPIARRGPRLMLPSVDSWNAAIQRAISSTLTVTATYVGNKGTHTYVGDWMYTFPNSPQAILPSSQAVVNHALYYDPSATASTITSPIDSSHPDIDSNGHTANSNYLRPLYGKFGWSQDVYYNSMSGDTHYHALQISVEKRYDHGLAITGNYSFQKASNYDSANFTVDKKVTYGPTDMNFDQVATIFGFYRTPFGRDGDFFKGVPRWVDALIGGYQLTPSINIASGQHFSIAYTNCSSILPQIAGIRAENAAQPCYPNQSGAFPMKLGKFNPATHSRSYFTPVDMMVPGVNTTSGVFSMPSLDSIGNTKRNAYTGPSTWNVDLAATKTVAIREGKSVQFRVNAFNAFNHINASSPTPYYSQFGFAATIDNPYIGGQIYNKALGTTPRQLNFAAKFQF